MLQCLKRRRRYIEAIKNRRARLVAHKNAVREAKWAEYVRHGGVDRLLEAWSVDKPITAAKLRLATELVRGRV